MSVTPVPDPGMPTGVEHRRERRVRVLKAGRIVFNGGYSVFDCRVKNLSDGGALLEMGALVGIPSHFDIVLDGSARRPCTVMWRTERLMGVSFDDAPGKAA